MAYWTSTEPADPPSEPHDALAYMLTRTPRLTERDTRYRLAAKVVRAALDLLATLRAEAGAPVPHRRK